MSYRSFKDEYGFEPWDAYIACAVWACGGSMLPRKRGFSTVVQGDRVLSFARAFKEVIERYCTTESATRAGAIWYRRVLSNGHLVEQTEALVQHALRALDEPPCPLRTMLDPVPSQQQSLLQCVTERRASDPAAAAFGIEVRDAYWSRLRPSLSAQRVHESDVSDVPSHT